MYSWSMTRTRHGYTNIILSLYGSLSVKLPASILSIVVDGKGAPGWLAIMSTIDAETKISLVSSVVKYFNLQKKQN